MTVSIVYTVLLSTGTGRGCGCFVTRVCRIIVLLLLLWLYYRTWSFVDQLRWYSSTVCTYKYVYLQIWSMLLMLLLLMLLLLRLRSPRLLRFTRRVSICTINYACAAAYQDSARINSRFPVLLTPLSDWSSSVPRWQSLMIRVVDGPC